jgi:imidazolonepropionase-like amidohydrolase
MRISKGFFACAIAAMALPMASSAPAAPGKFVAPTNQVVVIKAGRLYEPKSGTYLANQVVIIHGDRIADVGPNLAIPAGATVIDLSNSTVMPGMIDAHVHTNASGDTAAERALWALASAELDLDAGFTTIKDMDSRGGFDTVDLRDLINSGTVQGPRMQVVGQSLNNRNMRYVRDPGTSRYYTGRTEGKDINGPWLARAAVREAKNHGVDYIKIYATEDYVAGTHLWTEDGTFQVFDSITAEEVTAIVDEAHRLGLKVACHDYGGGAKDPCLVGGVDEPNHLLQLDAAGVKLMQEHHSIFIPTIDDLVGLDKEDLEASGGRNSRLRMLEAAVKRAHAAGIEIAFGSGSTTPPGGSIPHGKQADQFPIYLKWGFTPAEALRTSYVGAVHTLNYHMERDIGSVEKGKFADIIAVAGDPLKDITEMQRVKFVMKGGMVVRDNASATANPLEDRSNVRGPQAPAAHAESE